MFGLQGVHGLKRFCLGFWALVASGFGFRLQGSGGQGLTCHWGFLAPPSTFKESSFY